MPRANDQQPGIATLRSKRKGTAQVEVLTVQRERMLTAVVAAVEQRGYARLTVGQIVERAGVSRKTFYDIFNDRDDCFLAAFEQAVSQARVPLRAAYERERDWRKGIKSALFELLTLMEERPGLAKLCVVDAFAASEQVLEYRGRVLDELAVIVDGGRRLVKDRRVPAGMTAEGVVGGVFAVLHTRLVRDERSQLTDLLSPLMSMIVLPYLGPRVADKELKNGAHKRARVSAASCLTGGEDPLAGLKLRLTYRTVRVLVVIGENPGISNRSVAQGSGVLDQGQISRLLSRLARLDLIENRGPGQPRGGSNEWHLTARGAALERATRPRAISVV
jgi:AcrR family transcriptional regulator